jgi:GDP-4-dehydro-6-deoxy-D-mannose reductase
MPIWNGIGSPADDGMVGRLLITGAAGFVGQWLSRAMLDNGWTVFGGSIDGAPQPGVLTRQSIDAIRWLPLDVRSEESVRAAVAASRPDCVAHLAGIAYPPEANADPERAHDVNAVGVTRVIAALEAAAPSARLLVVGSADQYGPHTADEYPLPESSKLAPLSAYGRSKVAQETLALQASAATGVPVVLTRSFNHSGAGHASTYLIPSLVGRARELPREGGTLRIGNSQPIRDYLHVADVIDAYMLLLAHGRSGEVYNVSSGRGFSVRQIAERVLKRVGVTAEITEDPALVRPNDMPILVGDNTKLRRATGWRPSRNLEDIIDDLIHASPR